MLDDTTVAIAERPGNRRADGYANILANPHVGIISIIPGRNETLRINGRARLLRDAPFFDEMAVRGRRPILALLVEIDQIFFHCPKAFMRSQLWQPQSWRPDALPSPAALVKAVQETPETLEELEDYYAPANLLGAIYSPGRYRLRRCRQAATHLSSSTPKTTPAHSHLQSSEAKADDGARPAGEHPGGTDQRGLAQSRAGKGPGRVAGRRAYR